MFSKGDQIECMHRPGLVNNSDSLHSSRLSSGFLHSGFFLFLSPSSPFAQCSFQSKLPMSPSSSRKTPNLGDVEGEDCSSYFLLIWGDDGARWGPRLAGCPWAGCE